MAKRNIFNSVKETREKSNAFDLSHDVKLSCNMAQLVPIMCTEAVPGDRFKINCESLVRFAPLVSPMMHRCDVSMHYFFVPNRLTWSNFEDFITSKSTPAFPTINIQESNYTRLMDYLGIPSPATAGATGSETVSALPFAAYQMIYNEYYRDQNLQSEINFALSDGNNTANTALTALRKRGWEHDYFTAALPTAQQGAAVDVPFGDVVLKDNWASISGAGAPSFEDEFGTKLAGDVTQDNVGFNIRISADTTRINAYDPDGTLEVEATTISTLRRAFRLQEWLEKAMRGGKRYIENIWSQFGVKSSDKRLQRPEYITGVKTPIQISEVLNTAGEGTRPQGDMAGHGIGVVSGNYGSYFCEEHGYIIGIMSIMPKTAYQQGIPRHFLKTSDPFQWYWPSFAHIGEQEVQNKEIYAFQGTTGADTFGYVPRYSEYKFENSRVAGDFRTTLDFWHMGRKFASAPALNAAFIECDPTFRVFAVEDEEVDHMLCHVYNHVTAVRLMPKFGTPTI